MAKQLDLTRLNLQLTDQRFCADAQRVDRIPPLNLIVIGQVRSDHFDCLDLDKGNSQVPNKSGSDVDQFFKLGNPGSNPCPAGCDCWLSRPFAFPWS